MYVGVKGLNEIYLFFQSKKIRDADDYSDPISMIAIIILFESIFLFFFLAGWLVGWLVHLSFCSIISHPKRCARSTDIRSFICIRWCFVFVSKMKNQKYYISSTAAAINVLHIVKIKKKWARFNSHHHHSSIVERKENLWKKNEGGAYQKKHNRIPIKLIIIIMPI